MSIKSISKTDLNDALQSTNPPALFDVRKKPAFDSDPDTLPNATWQVFDQVQNWGNELSDDIKANPVVVYCVHGHEVSQNAAKVLNELGFDARYLEGGIAQWKETGLPVDKA